MRRHRLLDDVMDEVYYYGGLPMRLGDIITDMDKTAKSVDKKNWFNIREAGLRGLMQYHKYKPLENVTPISMDEFNKIMEDWG